MFLLTFHLQGNAEATTITSPATLHIDDSGIELIHPMGIRRDDGKIVPFKSKDRSSHDEASCNHTLETHYVGEQEHVAQHLAQLVILISHEQSYQVLTMFPS